VDFSPKFLTQCYNGLIAEFHQQFHLAQTELREEPIHDLRVSLKKIRALFRLIEYLDSAFDETCNFRPFRKIFKEAGLIRDIQVQIELMKDFDKSSDRRFKSYLRDLETGGKIRFRQKLTATNLDGLTPINNEVAAAAERINISGLTGRVINFIAEKTELTTRHFHDGTNSETMHRSRILLKDAYYILQMLQEFDVQPKHLNKLLKRVDQLQETFGTWHDWEVTLHHFEDYMVYRRI